MNVDEVMFDVFEVFDELKEEGFIEVIGWVFGFFIGWLVEGDVVIEEEFDVF